MRGIYIFLIWAKKGGALLCSFSSFQVDDSAPTTHFQTPLLSERRLRLLRTDAKVFHVHRRVAVLVLESTTLALYEN